MRLTSRWLVICLAVCASFVPRRAVAQDDRLPLKDTRVDVAISGVIADVTVRQLYENRGQRPPHARYIVTSTRR